MHAYFFSTRPRVLRGWLLIFAVLAWGLGLSAQGTLAKTLVVGVPVDHFPVSFKDKAQLRSGLAVELLEKIAKEENLQLAWVEGSTETITRRFLQGEFDLMLNFTPGIGYQGTGLYSIPYLKMDSAFFTRQESGYRQTSQLKGKRFAVLSYSRIGTRYLSDIGLMPTEITETGTTEQALQLLQDGEVDVAYASVPLVAVHLLEQKNHGIAKTGTAIIGYDLRFCIGVRAGLNALLERLNFRLTEYRENGEYDALYHRWIGYASAPLLSREQILFVLLLTIAVLAILAGAFLWHQRMLLLRIESQAQELGASRAILERAQQLARVGYFRYDSASHLLDCSDETLNIIERKRSDGPPSYHKLMSMVAPPDRAQVHRATRKAFTLGSVSEVIYQLEPRPGVRKTVHLSLQPITDRFGKFNGLLGTLQDVSTQRETEQELRTHEQLLRALYENVPAAMGVVEQVSGVIRIVSANRVTATLFGLPADTELNGQFLNTIGLKLELLMFWSHWLGRGFDQPDKLTAEQKLESLGRHYTISLVPMNELQGQAARVCYFIEDVTTLRQADAEVAQSRRQRAVGELVCGIAHEFNNLLTPILLKTEALSHELGGNDYAMQELKTIVRASKRGAELSKRLLAVGRPADSEPELHSLQTVVASTLDLVRSSVDRRVIWTVEIPAHLPRLYLNPSDLQQALVNLLLNARDTLMEKLNRPPAAGWQPRIHVEAQSYSPEKIEGRALGSPDGAQPLGWISLSVRDNGMGLPPERVEKLFSPALSSEGADAKIPGLGLATASLLMSRLGGKITVQSVPGEGSTFNLWVPWSKVAAPDAGPKAAEDVKAKSPAMKLDAARVLFVEDDDLVAQTIIMALRRQKHTVTHFTNGEDAWRFLSVHPHDFDLLLLDLDLPGINGLEVARRARGSRYLGKIIVTSGRLPEVGTRALAELKVDAQIEKPFTPQSLHLAIVTALNPAGKT